MRAVTNLNHKDAQAVGWKILIPLECEVVGKAVLETKEETIMKSTKRFKVEGGYIYNTSTEYHKGSEIAIAEALVFVPEK
uniref:Uncharacterized protein n=1 Tax=viral metagenome TaxID=1070528 RepID=A0A6H1ZXU6_9ZZZZ